MWRAQDEVEVALKTVDAIVIPTTAIAAPPMGSERLRVGEVEVPLRSALVDLNRPGNFTGLPAISVPCGLTQGGLPVAVQFVGRRFDEGRMIAIARRFSEIRSNSQTKRPPVGYSPRARAQASGNGQCIRASKR